MASLQAFFGGTFDPVHYGHLKTIEALARQADLQQVTLLPNHVPPHRPQPEASVRQRVAMLRLAIADRPLFKLDLRELQRSSPSYTVETLEQLRTEVGNSQPLGFIIGQDSLLTLSQWHRWHELLDLCHLLVCQRPGYPVRMPTPALQQWLAQHQTRSVRTLHQQPAGFIWSGETPLLAISATEIRRRYRSGESCTDMLPAAVASYITRQGLYRA